MTQLNRKPMHTLSIRFCVLAALVLLSFSCKKKEDEPQANRNEPYAVALRAQGAEGSTDYILQVGNIMEGEISAVGKGIEQAGWNYYMGSGNSLFSINYGDEGTIAYTLNGEGALVEKGRFWVDRLDCMGKMDDNHAIGIGAPWGGGSYDCEFMVIDADKVAITSRRTQQIYTSYPGDVLNKWPTGALGRDNKIYVPFYPLDGSGWTTPETDTAFINVYKYPTLEFEKTIKDTRTSPIGQYGSVPCIFKTESGDIYTISSSSKAASYTQSTKPSGILRIKNGEEVFDASYFFNFEDAMNGRLLMGQYLGNGKALVRYIPVSTDDASSQWDTYEISRPICNLAIVDLENKSVTPVTGIPKHGNGYAGALLIENGKAYISISSTEAGEVRVYEIDPSSGVATKGALVQGNEIPLIYKMQ